MDMREDLRSSVDSGVSRTQIASPARNGQQETAAQVGLKRRRSSPQTEFSKRHRSSNDGLQALPSAIREDEQLPQFLVEIREGVYRGHAEHLGHQENTLHVLRKVAGKRCYRHHQQIGTSHALNSTPAVLVDVGNGRTFLSGELVRDNSGKIPCSIEASRLFVKISDGSVLSLPVALKNGEKIDAAACDLIQPRDGMRLGDDVLVSHAPIAAQSRADRTHAHREDLTSQLSLDERRTGSGISALHHAEEYNEDRPLNSSAGPVAIWSIEHNPSKKIDPAQCPQFIYGYSQESKTGRGQVFFLTSDLNRYVTINELAENEPGLLQRNLSEAGVGSGSNREARTDFDLYPRLLFQKSRNCFVSGESEIQRAFQTQEPLAKRYDMSRIFVREAFRSRASRFPRYVRLSSFGQSYADMIVSSKANRRNAKANPREIVPRACLLQLGLDVRTHAKLPRITSTKAKLILDELGIKNDMVWWLDKGYPLILRGDDPLFQKGLAKKDYISSYVRLGETTDIWRLVRVGGRNGGLPESEVNVGVYKEFTREQKEKLDRLLTTSDAAYLPNMGLRSQAPKGLMWSERVFEGYEEPLYDSWDSRLTAQEMKEIGLGPDEEHPDFFFCSDKDFYRTNQRRANGR